MIMTEEHKSDKMIKAIEHNRIKRRSLLKAGAAVAPLAITLHGGLAMASVTSAGCVEDLEKHIEVPHYELDTPDDGTGLHETYHRSSSDHDQKFDPEFGKTGRKIHDKDGLLKEESHWDYIINEESTGASCLQSFANKGYEHHDDDDHHGS